MQTTGNYEYSLYMQNFINGVLDEMYPILENAPDKEVESLTLQREKLKEVINRHMWPVRNYAEKKMEWSVDTLRIAMQAIEKQL